MSEPVIIETRTNLSSNVREVVRARSASAPGVLDDTNKGFVAGSIWEKINAAGAIVALYVATSVTAGAAAWRGFADEIAGTQVRFLEEDLVFAASATADMVGTIPAMSVPIAAVMNNKTAVVYSTAVKAGLGLAADPDGYALSVTTLTKNAKSRGLGALCGVMTQTAVSPRITACDTNGGAAGTITSGTITARVYYRTFDDIPDAA